MEERDQGPGTRNSDDQGRDGKRQGAELDSSLKLDPSSFIFITVAEPSADRHAAELIRRLREMNPAVRVEGIGGEQMRAAGAVIHHESTSGAAMGWRAGLRAREVSRWLKWTKSYFDRQRPALQICCDSWSMNWHFAKLAKQRGIPVLYYIAPQTWASREGRVNRLRQFVDRLACILPFEEQYFRKFGIDATFVGHPLFDELPADRGKAERREFPLHAPVIGLLPGSRRGIVRHNFPHLLNVARRIRAVFPEAQYYVPATAATHELVTRLAADFPRLTIVRDGFDRVIPRCDFCVTVSGTAALHIAAYGVPFVVVYRVNPLHWHLAGRWIVKARTYSLVNILSSEPEKIVPEFIPWYASDKPVADCVIDYLNHPEKMAEQARQLSRMVRPLDHRGASKNVAQMAAEMIGDAARPE